jgi:signal peptidase I
MSKTFLRRYFIAAVVGAAVLVALVVRARMAYQLFDIPSESMAPTLRIGDHFIVWREAYSSGGPQYGDIVVFRVPQLASVPFVKRIVGLPHDRIRMSGGVLYINGAPASQHRLPDFFDECGNGSRCPVPQYLETLPAGRVGRVLDRVSNGPGDDTETVVVPSDS